MCQFFSCISDGKGKVLFFTIEDIVKIMSTGNKEEYNFNSHTSIAHFYKIEGSNEDKWNKWEYNPKTEELKIDNLVTTKDSSSVKKIISKYLKDKDILYLQNLYGKNTGDRNTGDRNTGDRNTGDRNTGDRNTGDSNTGDRNTGDRNTGDRNTGDRNTGHWNTGDSNTGDRNTGDRNTGDRNTGHWNTGDRNTGHWNTGHWNTGIFNTISPKMLCFNLPSEMSMENWYNHPSYKASLSFSLTSFISYDVMSEKEKKENPDYKIIGGYLKALDFLTACKLWWKKLTKEEQNSFKTLPNFDKRIFKEITGIVLK